MRGDPGFLITFQANQDAGLDVKPVGQIAHAVVERLLGARLALARRGDRDLDRSLPELIGLGGEIEGFRVLPAVGHVHGPVGQIARVIERRAGLAYQGLGALEGEIGFFVALLIADLKGEAGHGVATIGMLGAEGLLARREGLAEGLLGELEAAKVVVHGAALQQLAIAGRPFSRVVLGGRRWTGRPGAQDQQEPDGKGASARAISGCMVRQYHRS